MNCSELACEWSKYAHTLPRAVNVAVVPYCVSCAYVLQVWQGQLHVPGMFRAQIVADMIAGTGSIGSMLVHPEVGILCS